MSNKREIGLTMSFALADLPMLASAIAIGRNEALMSGRQQHRDRMEGYRKQFDAAVPPAGKAFGRYDFCDIVIAVGAGEPYEVKAVRREGWYADYDVTVTVKGRTYRAKETVKKEDDPIVAAIAAMLEEVSPL